MPHCLSGHTRSLLQLSRVLLLATSLNSTPTLYYIIKTFSILYNYSIDMIEKLSFNIHIIDLKRALLRSYISLPYI